MKRLKGGKWSSYKEVAVLLKSCALQHLFLSFILPIIHPWSCLPLQLRLRSQYCWSPITWSLPAPWKKRPLKTSSSRLLANKTVQRKPSESLSKNLQGEKKKAMEEEKNPIHVILQGSDPPRCHQTVPDLSNSSFLLLVHQEIESLNTVRTGTVCQVYKTWAALT